jgi:hypothetical protein
MPAIAHGERGGFNFACGTGKGCRPCRLFPCRQNGKKKRSDQCRQAPPKEKPHPEKIRQNSCSPVLP